MRRRFAIALAGGAAALAGLQGWGTSVAADPTARLLSDYEIPRAPDWVGGLSGIDLSADGDDVFVITDRGHLAQGSLTRENGAITDMSFDTVQPILNRFGAPHATQFVDAEGLAVAEDGRIFISFETEDRVSVFDGFGQPERLAGFSTAWRVFPKNQGLEALALAPDGSLWALPEFVWKAGAEARLYHRDASGEWALFAVLPTGNGFKPVGADFGPDGHLYILERGFLAIGFLTRVRRLTIEDGQITRVETLLQTIPGRHGNLEGLAVWRDRQGRITLTMVADDNFQTLQRSQVVEYVITDGLAQPKQ